MPGWDEPSIEITRKFAHNGYVAICPNLHFREGKATPQANSASVREAGGMPDDRTMGDVDGAIRYLRALRQLNGKVGIIGYCSGGRQVYLAACTLKGIDAAVPCYPGGVGQGAEGTTPRQPVDPLDLTKNLACPLLGFFGKEDRRPSPEHVARIEEALKKFGKTHELVRTTGPGTRSSRSTAPTIARCSPRRGGRRSSSGTGSTSAEAPAAARPASATRPSPRAGPGGAVDSIRLSQQIRAIGYRDGDFLRLVSLHPDHDSAYER